MAPISMPRGGPKILVPLVAAVAVLGGGAVFLGQAQQLQEVKQRLAVAQQDAASQRAENESLTQQMTGLQAERKTLEERLASVRTQLASATDDLEQSRLSLADLTSRYEQLTAERSQLQVQVATTTSERDEARLKSIRLEARTEETTRSLSRMRERLALLNRDYKQVSDKLAALESAAPPSIDIVGTIGSPDRSAAPVSAASPAVASSAPVGSVELPPIIVRTDGGTSSGNAAVRGRLLEVNQAHNFVVVDKGSQDGVRVGMAFDILRGSASIGRATVVRVRPKLSACDIVRSKTPGQLQIGDTAVQGGL